MGGGGGGGGGGGSSEAMEVPVDAVGLVIGKGGETIKALQTNHGVRINIQRNEEAAPTSSVRVITLVGNDAGRAGARAEIEGLVSSRDGGGGGFGGGGFWGGGGRRRQQLTVSKLPSGRSIELPLRGSVQVSLPRWDVWLCVCVCVCVCVCEAM